MKEPWLNDRRMNVFIWLAFLLGVLVLVWHSRLEPKPVQPPQKKTN